MNKPTWLKDKEARKFFTAHAPALVDAGRLHEQNLYSFALGCEVWGHMRKADTSDVKGRIWYIGLLKHFTNFTKQFGLSPNLSRGQSADKAASIQDIIGKLTEG